MSHLFIELSTLLRDFYNKSKQQSLLKRNANKNIHQTENTSILALNNFGNVDRKTLVISSKMIPIDDFVYRAINHLEIENKISVYFNISCKYFFKLILIKNEILIKQKLNSLFDDWVSGEIFSLSGKERGNL